MRLRRAVPKIPAKSSVSPRSPLYKLRPLPTPSESTLPQVLIPLHFKSRINNVYKNRGVGCSRPAPKFVNSSLAPRHISARAAVRVYFDLRPRGAIDRATAHPEVLSLSLLDVSPQISENTATLSPFAATLTSRVKPKSCVCHSYKKTPGGGYPSRDRFPLPRRHRHTAHQSCRHTAHQPHRAAAPARHPSPNLSSRGNRGICFSILDHGTLDTRHYPLPTTHNSLSTHRATVLKNG
jgi:hypothetical protein